MPANCSSGSSSNKPGQWLLFASLSRYCWNRRIRKDQ